MYIIFFNVPGFEIPSLGTLNLKSILTVQLFKDHQNLTPELFLNISITQMVLLSLQNCSIASASITFIHTTPHARLQFLYKSCSFFQPFSGSILLHTF